MWKQRARFAGLLLAAAAGLGSLAVADEKPTEANAVPTVSARPAKTLLEWAEGNGTEAEAEAGAEEEEPLATDRPDTTEASTTVGLGRIQLEGGYTFTRDKEGGVKVRSHSFPETLLRVGMLAEWFEFRLGWNYLVEDTISRKFSDTVDGAEDLYLGVKLALTEQQDCLPETAIIFQMTTPTGSEQFTADEVLPGLNYLYSWELDEFFSLAGSTGANRALEHSGHSYVELSQTLSLSCALTGKLSSFLEWFAFMPHSAVDSGIGPEHYLNGGLTYLITDNFQIDWRAGFGLNDRSDDFFTGAGFGIRY